MSWLNKDTFVCLDCETTGLDPEADAIIEVAVIIFTGETIVASFESLIDPEREIPKSSTEIHHITQEMVAGKPKIEELLPQILKMIGTHTVIGHGVAFDLNVLAAAAAKASLPCTIQKNRIIDTLRLARDYGDSPSNALQKLGVHFNLSSEGAHRAMNDVRLNIEVFKQLASRFQSRKQLFAMLAKPIMLKHMPLGKHKGRPIREVPLQYLQWAAHKDFDQDLLFTIRSEISRRKKGNSFEQASNPFNSL